MCPGTASPLVLIFPFCISCFIPSVTPVQSFSSCRRLGHVSAVFGPFGVYHGLDESFQCSEVQSTVQTKWIPSLVSGAPNAGTAAARRGPMATLDPAMSLDTETMPWTRTAGQRHECCGALCGALECFHARVSVRHTGSSLKSRCWFRSPLVHLELPPSLPWVAFISLPQPYYAIFPYFSGGCVLWRRRVTHSQG